MTTLPDFRINLQPPLIDFPNTVGLTGLAIDTFPQPGIARYDWLRSYLLGLISHQASFNSPVNFAIGSLWFNLNNLSFQVRTNPTGPIITNEGSEWIDLSNAVMLDTGLTLAAWYQQVKAIINNVDPSVSSIFSRLTNASTGGQPISAGSLVYVSGNGQVSLADKSSPTTANLVGVATVTASAGSNTVVQHVGLVSLLMTQGLTVSAGNKIWLGLNGIGTNVIPGSGTIVQVGTVFDASTYNASAANPSVMAILNVS